MTSSERSPYVYAYSAYVASVEESAAQTLQIAPIELRQNGVTDFIFEHLSEPSNVYRSAVVTVESMENRGAVVTYKVTVGAYVVKVRLLNVHDDARTHTYQRVINSGAFGKIVLGSACEYEFVSKRFLFTQTIKLSQKTSSTEKWVINANFSELETVLQEFALAKICSLFKVGPKILNPYGFDIVCYRNCVEFCMERCFPWSLGSNEAIQPLREERLKHCMRVMHLLRIVHRDIKPGNIVFSPSLGNLVLCDFGISHPIAEEIGFKTKTVQSGTRSFMSHEMSSLSAVTPGYVDLFYNDMHCLQVSVKVMELQRPEIQMFLQVPQNPLCRVSTILYQLWAHQSVYPSSQQQQIHSYIKQFITYFPQIKGLFAPGRYLEQQPTSKYFDIEFVASSLPFDAKIHYYLQLCDQEDPKVDAILRRVNQRQFDTVHEWTNEQLNTQRNWRIAERQLNVLKNEQKSLNSKQQTRAICLARNLFLLNVRKGERIKYCEALLEFCSQYKNAQDTAAYRLMLIFAFKQPSFGEMDEVRAASASWSMETLNVFSEIAQLREMHKLRQCLLRRLVEMCFSSSHYKLFEYSTRLNELEIKLYGYNRYSEHLDRYFTGANTKSPAEWGNNDFRCLGLVIAEGSIKRARVLVEKLLPYAPRYRHPTLLFWLGKCYLSESRYGESIKCLQMSVAMMQDNPRYWLDRLLAMRLLALAHAYVGNTSTCLTILSMISAMRLDSEAAIQVRIEVFLTYARVYSSEGNFEELIESFDNARRLLNPFSKDFSNHIKIFWLSVFYEYLELLKHEHPKKLTLRIVDKGLSEIEEYSRLKAHYNILDKYIITFVMELKGTCLLTLGDYAPAYEHLKETERLSSEMMEANQSNLYQLFQKLVRCQWKLSEFENMEVRRKSLKERRLTSLQVQTEQEGVRTFISEVLHAQMSLLLKNDSELQDSISRIKEYLEKTADPLSFKILRNFIEYAQEGNRYDILLGLRKLQMQIHPRPDNEFAVGLCLYRLGNIGECMQTLKRMLFSIPKEANLWLYACSYQLIYKSLECEGNKEQAESYRKLEFQCLQELTRVEVTNIEAHYRLAVCLFRDGLVKQAKQRLLMSAVMSLQRQSVDNSLAVDCYKIFVRRKPRLVTRLLQECSERTPQVLHYLCRSYLELKKERKFYSTVNELIRTKSEEVNLLCEYLVKQGKHIEKELLFGETTTKEMVTQPIQKQRGAILESTFLKRMRRRKLCRDKGICVLTKRLLFKGYDV